MRVFLFDRVKKPSFAGEHPPPGCLLHQHFPSVRPNGPAPLSLRTLDAYTLADPLAPGARLARSLAADARAIAGIHLAARREAMPYLHRAHTDDETRDWFARIAGDRLAAWWVARVEH